MTAVENRNDYELGRVNVTDRDDTGTKNWKAKYFILNDYRGNFAVRTDPITNQGVLTVVKVKPGRGREEGMVPKHSQKQGQQCGSLLNIEHY